AGAPPRMRADTGDWWLPDPRPRRGRVRRARRGPAPEAPRGGRRGDRELSRVHRRAAQGAVAMLTESGEDVGATTGSGTVGAMIDRLRAGDTTALEGLMERFTPRVYRLAHGSRRSEADAGEGSHNE